MISMTSPSNLGMAESKETISSIENIISLLAFFVVAVKIGFLKNFIITLPYIDYLLISFEKHLHQTATTSRLDVLLQYKEI